MIGTELVVVEEVIDTGKEIANILKPEVISDILDKVREKYLTGFIADVSTPAGRDEIRNRAQKPVKVKTTIEKAGAQYAKELKALPKIIDAERKRLKDGCDAIRDEIRAPLTEWENIRKEIDQQILALASNTNLSRDTSACVAEDLEELLVIDVASIVEDKQEEFSRALASAINAQYGFLSQRIQEENDKEEFARLKAEEEERQRKADEEERIRKAEQAAAEKAEREARERELQAKLDKEKAEREAENAKREAEQAKIDAEKAKADAERKAQEAAANAKREAEDEAERKRAEEQRLKDEAERKERERQANEQHRKKVRDKAETSFRTLGYSSDEAERIVALIDSGKVSNISIDY